MNAHMSPHLTFFLFLYCTQSKIHVSMYPSRNWVFYSQLQVCFFFPSPRSLFFVFCFSMLLNFERKVKVRPDRWCSKAVAKSTAMFCLFTAWVPSKLDTLRSRLLEGGTPLMVSKAAIKPSHRYHHTLCPLWLDFGYNHFLYSPKLNYGSIAVLALVDVCKL